jgi:tetratricopeptide (TPR) repeat protein
VTGNTNTAVEQAHGELSLARVALADGDLSHAANHVAGAIAVAPDLPEVHELLSALAARSGGGLDLFPLDGRMFIGTVVARAHLLARTDAGAALELLAQATAHDPSLPWADAPWLRSLDAGTVDAGVYVRVFARVMSSVGEPATNEVRAANDVYLDLARRAVAAYPEHGLVYGAASGIARRIGETSVAVRWGERGWQLAAEKSTGVWFAHALKADGQLDRAVAVLREVNRRNPFDLDVSADIANWLAEAGRLDEALSVLDQALEVDPSYDCAVHTTLRLRFQKDGDVRHLVELSDFMREHPAAGHEHSDLEDCCRNRPWLGLTPMPIEASVDVLAQLRRGGRQRATLSLSALEVPSALALLRRELPRLEVRVATPPPPDMLTPLDGGLALWRYHGAEARPAVRAPSPRASALLADVATPRWVHPVGAYDQALPLGELPAEELLALLVHPPVRPDHLGGLPGGVWERATQVFACLGLLHCQALRARGERAPRRLLTDIAFGIEDWTVEAALFGLTVAAWVEPACRVEVRDTVARRLQAAAQAARHRAVSVLGSLAELALVVPDRTPELTALARHVLPAGPNPI